MIPPVLAATLIRSTKCFWLKNSETQPKLSSKPSAYKRLLLLTHQEDSLCSREVPSSILVAKTMNLPMQLMLMSKGKEPNLSSATCSSFITSVINFSDLKNYTKVDCAFHYWAEQHSKVLSQMAWIVFAVPMTQVLVESLLRGVKFILSDLRNSLAEDTLQATMLQRANVWAY